MTVETIVCRMCQTEKEAEKFRVQSNSKLGRGTTCNNCRAKYRREKNEYLSDTARRHAKRAGQRIPLVTVDDYLDVIATYKDCAYCGIELTDDTRTFDHVYPLSSEYGGKHIRENLVSSCRQCNSSKGNSLSVFDYYQRSEKFTDALWRSFTIKFISRMIKREISEHEVEEMTFHMKAESEEICAWLAWKKGDENAG